MKEKYAVLGAGNGGQAFAGVLSSKGFDVALWNRTASIVESINTKGGIELTGVIKGFFEDIEVTNNLQEAISGAKVIIITTPAHAHAELSVRCAPFLEDNQIIVLNPGRTGGALEVHNVLKERGINHLVTVAETQTLIYVSRAIQPGLVELREIKTACPFAAMPAYETQDVVHSLKKFHEEFIPATSVLETGLNNIGAIFHPTPLILNAARAETPNECYDHYLDGISPSVGSFLERLDAERVAVANRFGVRTQSAKDWICSVYGSPPLESLYEVFQKTPVYKGIGAPSTLKHRYILEDIPTGLVPISSLGRLAGVPTPAIDSVVNLVSAFYDIDFWLEGRTTGKLGIEGMRVGEVLDYVKTGLIPSVVEPVSATSLVEEWSIFD